MWKRIRHILHRIGDFQARLLLGLLYVIFVLPTGLIARLGGSLLDHHASTGQSFWRSREPDSADLRHARRQG
ncbi:MAG: hypothetical protein D6790_06170 [Caldilineae bacterium]|nr:MAG: hypothetical protein D6790_06170 [Caldilineae bacterium]